MNNEISPQNKILKLLNIKRLQMYLMFIMLIIIYYGFDLVEMIYLF